MRRPPGLRIVAFAALTAVLIAGCDSLPGRPTAAQRPLRPNEVRDFDTLYGQNCAGCHGANGNLGAAPALNNPVYLALVDGALLRQVVAQGRSGTQMPGFAKAAGGFLTAEQIDILVTGIRQRWGIDPKAATGAPPYADSGAGDPAHGAQAFSSFCASCHGKDGQGGSAGSVVDPNFLSLVSDQCLRTVIIAGRPDLGHPDWQHDQPGQALSGQQVTDLVAWLASLRPRAGGPS